MLNFWLVAHSRPVDLISKTVIVGVMIQRGGLHPEGQGSNPTIGKQISACFALCYHQGSALLSISLTRTYTGYQESPLRSLQNYAQF